MKNRWIGVICEAIYDGGLCNRNGSKSLKCVDQPELCFMARLVQWKKENIPIEPVVIIWFDVPSADSLPRYLWLIYNLPIYIIDYFYIDPILTHSSYMSGQRGRQAILCIYNSIDIMGRRHPS